MIGINGGRNCLKHELVTSCVLRLWQKASFNDRYKLSTVNIEKKHYYEIHPSSQQGWPIQCQYTISGGVSPPQRFRIPSTLQNPFGSVLVVVQPL